MAITGGGFGGGTAAVADAPRRRRRPGRRRQRFRAARRHAHHRRPAAFPAAASRAAWRNLVPVTASGGAPGSAFGSGIFVQGNDTLTFAPGSGQTLTIADVIADQSGSGGTGSNAGVAAVLVKGPGTVVLGGDNTFTGGTTVKGAGAILSISADDNLGAASSEPDARQRDGRWISAAASRLRMPSTSTATRCSTSTRDRPSPLRRRSPMGWRPATSTRPAPARWSSTPTIPIAAAPRSKPALCSWAMQAAGAGAITFANTRGQRRRLNSRSRMRPAMRSTISGPMISSRSMASVEHSRHLFRRRAHAGRHRRRRHHAGDGHARHPGRVGVELQGRCRMASTTTISSEPMRAMSPAIAAVP